MDSLTNSGKVYTTSKDQFEAIPGVPIAYWVGKAIIHDFRTGTPFARVGFPRVGMQTSNNDKFLRLWFEISAQEFFSNDKKWIKYIKGGTFRKWYGNLDYVLWYNRTPTFILSQKNARVLPEEELTLPKCTWTDLATTRYSCRVAPIDSFHDISGHCFYPGSKDYYYLLGLANSVVFQTMIDLLNSSLHYQVGDVARVPVICNEQQIENVEMYARSSVEASQKDWDSFETSWDFKKHPLI